MKTLQAMLFRTRFAIHVQKVQAKKVPRKRNDNGKHLLLVNFKRVEGRNVYFDAKSHFK